MDRIKPTHASTQDVQPSTRPDGLVAEASNPLIKKAWYGTFDAEYDPENFRANGKFFQAPSCQELKNDQ